MEIQGAVEVLFFYLWARGSVLITFDSVHGDKDVSKILMASIN